MISKIKPTDKYKINDYYQCECGRKFYKPLSLSSHFAHCIEHHKVLGYDICDYHKCHKGCMSGWNKKSKEEINKIFEKSHKTLKQRFEKGELVGNFKGKHHTEETKEKIRRARCKYLSDGKQHGAFIKDKPSYIENLFLKLIEENKLETKFDIINEYHVYPYFLDFALVNLKIDFELDGIQHKRTNESIQHDIERDTYLKECGWIIYRILGKDIVNDFDLISKQVVEFLSQYKDSKMFGNSVYRRHEDIEIKYTPR